jgi:hypothetical protein
MTPSGTEVVVKIAAHRRWTRCTIPGFLLSEQLPMVCYWSTVVLLAVVGGYALYWRWAHSVLTRVLPNDPWGVSTPPWVVEAWLPLLMFGYLAEACRHAIQGNRRWKHLVTTSVLVGTVCATQVLAGFLTAR